MLYNEGLPEKENCKAIFILTTSFPLYLNTTYIIIILKFQNSSKIPKSSVPKYDLP